MPTNTINIPRSVRMRYFNGLFLQDQEFRTDQNFYIAIRRYLNFLLFDPGRLYVDDTVAPPLQVSAAGMQVSVTPGSALIRDTATKSGYELEIPDLPTENREFDLSTESLSDGDTLTVTLQRDESDFISMGGGGAGVSPSENDRTRERALLSVNLPGDPELTPPFVTLATITAVASGGGGVADTLNVTNTNERGGVRLAILSEEVRSMLDGGPGPGTLTGITISPSGSISLADGATRSLTASGQFDVGPDRPLSPADGLSWNSTNPAVVSVNADGIVTANTPGGPVTITAEVGTLSDEVTVNVVPTTPEPEINPVTPFDPQTARVNFFPVRIFGGNFAVDDPSPPTVRLIARNGEVPDTDVTEVVLFNDGEIQFRVPNITTTLTRIDMRIAVGTSGGETLSSESGPFFRWRPPS